MKVAVLGASGHLGADVVEALLASGIEVRAVGRAAGPLQARFGSRVEVVAAEVATAEGAAGAARGVDGIVYAIGLPYGGKSFARYPPMMRNALEGARSSGVRRFLHIAPVYPYGVPRTTPVTEAHPRQPNTVKGRLRKEQEDLVLAADAPGGLRTISLRLPDFLFAGDSSYPGRILDAARKGQRAQLVGPVDVAREFVHLPDAAGVVSALFGRDDAWGEAYNLAGPSTITLRDLTGRIFRAFGREPKFTAASKTMLRFLGIFDPLIRELPEMYYLNVTPVILDDAKLRSRMGPIRKTSYDDAIREAVGR